MASILLESNDITFVLLPLTDEEKKINDERVNELVLKYTLDRKVAASLVKSISLLQENSLNEFEEHLELLKVTLQLRRAYNNGESAKLSTAPIRGDSTIQPISNDNIKIILLFLNDIVHKQLHYMYDISFETDYPIQDFYNFFMYDKEPMYKFFKPYSENDLVKIIKFMDDYIKDWRRNFLKHKVKYHVNFWRKHKLFDNSLKTIKTNEAGALYDCLVWAGYGEELNIEDNETTKEKYDKIKHMLY